MTLYAEVVLSLPLDHCFTYIVPPSYQEIAKLGSRVLVPFSQRILTGFIVKLRKRKPAKELQFKEIYEVLDENPVFSPSFLASTQKLSEYYHSSWGELLQASLPSSFLLKIKTKISLTEGGKEALKIAELPRHHRKILNLLQKRAYSPFFIKRKLKIRNLSYLLSRLEKKGLIRIQRQIDKREFKKNGDLLPEPTQLEMDFSLDENSRQLADSIVRKSGRKGFSPFLLYGPIERREAVYFYLIKKNLEKKKKVLFLVPEISLTKTLIEKFEKRLGKKGACLHSRLSERRKEAEWRKIKEGDVEVVVGPRSALLSPLANIGLIIVDEEQDESYYQQESPAYDARKGAWFRAKQEGCALVYGSAFPSVEAYYRAKKRGYLMSLIAGRRKGKVEIVDDRGEKGIISQKLKEKIKEKLEKGKPILVFINRRGYASFIYCRRCNHIPRCIHCDISLTYHRKEEKLVCHYCGYSIPKITCCPQCEERMISKRGLGIEGIEEELKKLFPQTKIACFDSDAVKTMREQEKIFSLFAKRKIDILVGTQLLAHRLDLPSVSLVVIFYPETTLALSDFKASQKTFQNLIQMMKFADSDNREEIIIQTSFPDHFSIGCAVRQDYLSFFKQEIKFRRLMNYPPFSHMAEVLFQGENLRSLAQKSRQFSNYVGKYGNEIEILGPAMASVAKVRGMSRVQLVLKSQKSSLLNSALKESLKTVRSRKSVLIWD